MERKIMLLLLCWSLAVFGQKTELKTTIRADYDASLKLGDNYRKFQKFVLVGNSQDYYFAGIQNYLNDTGQYKARAGIDLRTASDYFQERLLKKEGSTTVFFKYGDDKIRYQEKVSLKWVLYGETKTINGIRCQMAATNKYGRRWIAYFSKEYPQSLGPYKFTGLPGLIFELYDTKEQYHFTLTKVEKYASDFTLNLSPFKEYIKDKYLKAKYNMENTLAAFSGLEIAGEERTYYQSLIEKRKKMYNNPIELNPFE
ncbi:GLPGLI family protein [uncultured Chryseobacterium sp.]|uniref:GLPGLI family protein n=1 Tax=uncultured Chryseobacterium sp. TaxID=259322 RepID=UPI0025E26A31|nr:GLPGLI family protein [uncultured Chryseobacterium sp.]